MTKIYTTKDRANDKLHAEYLREKAALTAKVKHWDAKAAQFGGAIYIATAEKFRNQLAAL